MEKNNESRINLWKKFKWKPFCYVSFISDYYRKNESVENTMDMAEKPRVITSTAFEPDVA